MKEKCVRYYGIYSRGIEFGLEVVRNGFLEDILFKLSGCRRFR